jgi:hypothetical protein
MHNRRILLTLYSIPYSLTLNPYTIYYFFYYLHCKLKIKWCKQYYFNFIKLIVE